MNYNEAMMISSIFFSLMLMPFFLGSDEEGFFTIILILMLLPVVWIKEFLDIRPIIRIRQSWRLINRVYDAVFRIRMFL